MQITADLTLTSNLWPKNIIANMHLAPQKVFANFILSTGTVVLPIKTPTFYLSVYVSVRVAVCLDINLSRCIPVYTSPCLLWRHAIWIGLHYYMDTSDFRLRPASSSCYVFFLHGFTVGLYDDYVANTVFSMNDLYLPRLTVIPSRLI